MIKKFYEFDGGFGGGIKQLNETSLDKIIKPKIQKFIKETLNGRYKDHVSDTFIEAYLMRQFKDIYFSNPKNTLENIAYKAASPLFEVLLEHECKAGGNGHHVAQSFCSYFLINERAI